MNKTAVHTTLHYFELSENWIHTQVKHLNGWDVRVLTNKTKNLDSVDWTPPIFERRKELLPGIYQADSIGMKILGYYPSFYRQARRSRAHLIHAHFGPMGYLSLKLARKLGIPLITTFYGYDASELPRQAGWQKKYRKLFEGGDLFLVEGPAMGHKLEKLGCPLQKIQVQHLGIEVDTSFSTRSYSTNNKLRILMVGRFVEKKGFIYGLKAFNRFLNKGGTGQLTIVGDSNDTPGSMALKKEMFNFVKEQNIEELVHFKGLMPLEALRKEYYKHNLFLAPSVTAANGDDEGGLPVTIIEAAATGLPIVGSLHCDIPEVVKPEVTGLLAKEKDDEQLSEHLGHLSQNPGERAQMGKAAAAHIQSHYNARNLGQRLAQIYDDISKRGA